MCYDFVKSVKKDRSDSIIPQQANLTGSSKFYCVHGQPGISGLHHAGREPKNPPC
jgi:hypothetical protein